MLKYLSLSILFVAFSASAQTAFENAQQAKAAQEQAKARAYNERAVQYRNKGIYDHIYIHARNLKQTPDESSIQCSYGERYPSKYIQHCDFVTQSLKCRISYGDDDKEIIENGYRTNRVHRVYLLQCLDANSREIIRRIRLKPIPQ